MNRAILCKNFGTSEKSEGEKKSTADGSGSGARTSRRSWLAGEEEEVATGVERREMAAGHGRGCPWRRRGEELGAAGAGDAVGHGGGGDDPAGGAPATGSGEGGGGLRRSEARASGRPRGRRCGRMGQDGPPRAERAGGGGARGGGAWDRWRSPVGRARRRVSFGSGGRLRRRGVEESRV
nr:glycine-rich protein DOT1-like [Aegilops tauschii subsp. strangulata]